MTARLSQGTATKETTSNIALGGLRFAAPAPPKTEKPKRVKVKPPRQKNDPRHVAAARELRDRYLEQFNSGLVLTGGKYEVARQIEGPGAAQVERTRETAKLLEAA